METKIPQEELNVFLKEAENAAKASSTIQKEKGRFLHRLVHSVKNRADQIKPTRSRSSLILCALFLGGLLLGSLLGFYFGRASAPAITYYYINPTNPPGEVIEPFKSPEQLALR